MDIHRVFAEAVALLDGKTTRLGRADMRRDRLEEFARTALTHDDHVVVEATGNAAAVAEVLAPHVGRVVIANPKQVRLIAHAKTKTDGIDAAVLAKLYASGFLPEVWVPDERTGALRRQVSRRWQLVRQRTRLINAIWGYLTEYGWVARRCTAHMTLLADMLDDDEITSTLPATALPMFRLMVDLLAELDKRVATLDREIARRAKEDEAGGGR